VDNENLLTDQDSPLAKLAKLCKMSIPQVKAFMPMKIPLEDIETYDDAATARHFGCITEDEWCRWCYEWRDTTFRYSNLGKDAATRWAEDNNLPPPSSERVSQR
tara:strand:- start:2962 stop:3273 length:312 start_codon:yes stop_codon:yes gene_type:complete